MARHSMFIYLFILFLPSSTAFHFMSAISIFHQTVDDDIKKGKSQI